MKNLIFSALFLLSTISLFSQSADDKKNSITLSAVPLGTLSYDFRGSLDGQGSYGQEDFYSFGLEYDREIITNLDVTTGVLYSYNKITYTPPFSPGANISTQDYRIDLITVPILAKYHFLNFLFVNGGGLLNFKISDSENHTSYGDTTFGLLIGAGGEYILPSNIKFVFNPHAQINDISSGRKVNFYNFGIKFGVGYNF